MFVIFLLTAADIVAERQRQMLSLMVLWKEKSGCGTMVFLKRFTSTNTRRRQKALARKLNEQKSMFPEISSLGSKIL